jgi:hypothetical protein
LATHVVVGLGATVAVVVGGAVVVVVAALVVVSAVVGAVAVVAVDVAGVAWVELIAEVELVTVLVADGEPPHAPRTVANATRVRSALGRIVR